ncbi:hypothetical protein SSBR45G_46330 [Bradyrhizobium sp. SSBR45G]|uniref:hypothetical protein n=1 Tax=unclassified Bradyrhizobium TaxID=2631580 RepID=UPI0023429D47|nr:MULTISPECIES: hypothetical protein [unclassified Bradyrhizobium]GLH79724.1 hypothetical protein SSBR45G_46330 [Bradyrhizobium sp. SSBR45G]GLH87158.1 hypothetical protein SSBR45R_46180 [Bradyrhizobium sp. SSBR45R]
MQTRRPNPQDEDEISRIDDIRRTVAYRDPDRPAALFAKPVIKRSPDVVRAQGRLRTARWRAENDRLKRATLEQIGLSLAVALAKSDVLDRLTEAESSLIRDHLADLHARGFSVVEARKTISRLRRKLRATAHKNQQGC